MTSAFPFAPPPRVAVIVLNWNGKEDTLECLASLRQVKYRPLDLLVVDNGSTDGSVAAIRAEHPGVTLLPTGHNLGFAGGNNVGIRAALEAGVDFVFLLNNDATVAPDAVDAFVDAARRFPDAGIFTAKIYYADDRRRIWYAGVHWRGAHADWEFHGQGVIDDGVRFAAIEETSPIGCAMFIRAELIRRIGPLDPAFFLLFEESDLAERARKAGSRTLLVPDAVAWHRVSASLGPQDAPLHMYFALRNRLLWSERHLPWAGRVTVWRETLRSFLLPWTGLLDTVGLLGRGRPREAYWIGRAWLVRLPEVWRDPVERQRRRVRRRAILDYVGRRFGDCPPSVRDVAGRLARRP